MERHPDLIKAERSLLAYAGHRRTVVAAGALLACFAVDRDHHLLQVAVPAGPEPRHWSDSVQALLGLQRDHGGVPRLEYMEELHPGLGAALSASGFVLEGRAPVMVAELSSRRPPRAAPRSDRVDLAGAAGPTLRRYLLEQARAFGMPVDTGLAFLARLRAGLADGSVLAEALYDGDRPVSGATLQVGGTWAELAGVWTAPERRRRGLAFRVCDGLLAAGTERGLAGAWLSAAPEAVELYLRLGFRPVGTQINFAAPRP